MYLTTLHDNVQGLLQDWDFSLCTWLGKLEHSTARDILQNFVSSIFLSLLQPLLVYHGWMTIATIGRTSLLGGSWVHYLHLLAIMKLFYALLDSGHY